MEIDYNAVFGIDASENETEVADQSEETTDPEEVEEVEEVEAEETEGENEDEVAEHPEQTKEERAMYARLRRKAEKDAEAKARANTGKYLDEAIAASGLINPYTNKAITTKAELDEYTAQMAKERRDSWLETHDVQEDELNEYVENLPEVQAARQAQQEMAQQKQQMVLDEQIKAVTKLDPNIKTVQDLVAHPKYAEIYDKVQRGYSIPDAFFIVNREELTSKSAAAAKQAALNKAKSKEHLESTSQRGQGAVTVPADVMAQYRLFNPKATEAEIQAHYNKYHK